MALVLFIYWFLHIILCKSDESNENFSPKSESNHIRIIQDPDDEIIKSDPSKHKKAQKIINFASESAGATVLATSDECSGFSSVLTDDKDKYAMCPCSAKKKHVTIGLSEDVCMLIISVVHVCDTYMHIIYILPFLFSLFSLLSLLAINYFHCPQEF